MTLLILGLLLWSGAHLFKRLAPDARAKLGDKGRGAIAIALFAALILMVLGFRSSETVDLYALPPYLRHVNNTLMIVAVFLLALGHSKSRLRAKMRHPMLTSVVVWGVAHLLVNADAASIVLFGGMTLWALVEMALITPPVGLNLYVVQGVGGGVSLNQVMVGALPFVGAMLVMALLLVLFPGIALYLPTAMAG